MEIYTKLINNQNYWFLEEIIPLLHQLLLSIIQVEDIIGKIKKSFIVIANILVLIKTK